MTRETDRQRVAWLADIGFAAVLAAMLLTASVSAVTASDLASPWRAAVLASLGLLHGTVATRSRWPVTSLGVASAAMLLLALAPDLSGGAAAAAGSPYSCLLLPSGLVFFVALYTVSSRTAPHLPQLALAVGALGCAVAVGRLWNSGTDLPSGGMGTTAWRLFVATAVTAGVLAAWALGRYRATRTAWVAALEQRAVRAEQDRVAAIEQARRDLAREAERAAAAERGRIAREMHDVVAHSLAVVVGQAEGGRMLLASEPDRATEVLSTIADQGRQALTEMRSLLGVLGMVEGDEDEVDAAASRRPQPGLADLDRTVDDVRRAGTTVEVLHTGPPGRLAATADLAAFRVVQESLTNVVKHASPGARATVALHWSERGLRIRVRDDGDHGGGPGLESPNGRGILGMRERLALVGGDVAYVGPDPSGAGGFVVEAWIPAAGPQRPDPEETHT